VAETVGSLIQRARGGRSGAEIAKRAGISKTTYFRLEADQNKSRLDDTRLAAIDKACDANGHLVRAINELSLWESQQAGVPAEVWIHNYPSAWSGSVWAEVLVMSSDEHNIRLRWGPWEYSMVDGGPPEHLVLCFSKGDDGQSIPLTVTVRPKCFVRFGIGPRNGIDVNHGWLQVEAGPDAFKEYLREILLARAGRSLDEVGAFLGMTPAAARALLGLRGRPDSGAKP
jgi:hypothetical protein